MGATPFYRLMKPAQAELRANIRQMAADRGWKLADLARKAPIKYGPLTQGLGAYRWFVEDEVDRIAAAFEVSADELMGDSVFKEEARGSEFDLPVPADERVKVNLGHGRALCCTCGLLRRFRRDELGRGREVLDFGDDPVGHRMVLQLNCEICGRETTHAELNAPNEYRDIAEERQAEPSREQKAIQRRDALISRLAGFNVDVHFRSRPEKDRARSYVTGYSFDESKDRWRIEIDPNAPGRLQSVALLQAWTAISSNEHGVDWDPKKGVVLQATDATWDVVVNDMLADIERALPVEQQRLRLHVVDEVMSAGDAEVSQ